jgi:hypothetical protein
MGILAADWPKRHILIDAMQKRGYVLRDVREFNLVFERRDQLTRMDIDLFFPWEGKVICLALERDGSYRGAWFPANAFDSLRTCTFLGNEVLIPDPPEPVLETMYGDWRTPAKTYDSNGSIPNRLDLPSAAKPDL